MHEYTDPLINLCKKLLGCMARYFCLFLCIEMTSNKREEFAQQTPGATKLFGEKFVSLCVQLFEVRLFVKFEYRQRYGVSRYASGKEE
jgi:hypothetical protein